jgi:alkanesulfonate monooxygenase SsuD/methylene tetrahydromethanopterin reductase-like flavin-dependent oxidoreductase (luciferase family)
VASQVATVDQLSGGRVTLGVGVGAFSSDLALTGEVSDLRERASMLDEGIDLIRALWSGERTFHGRHYDYRSDSDDLGEVARPVQPRVPIWVVGVWPRPKSLRRVLRCDGIIPQAATVADYPAMRAWLTERGASPELDVLAEGETPADDPAAGAAIVTPWAEAGCTWWMETRWAAPPDGGDRMRQIRDRITAGPPRVAP